MQDEVLINVSLMWLLNCAICLVSAENVCTSIHIHACMCIAYMSIHALVHIYVCCAYWESLPALCTAYPMCSLQAKCMFLSMFTIATFGSQL